MAYSLEQDTKILGEGVVNEENEKCLEVIWKRGDSIFATGYYTHDLKRILISIGDVQLLSDDPVNEWF